MRPTARRPPVPPLIPLAIAAALGILVDRYTELLGTTWWSLLGMSLAGVAFGLARLWPRAAGSILVVTVLVLAAGWHHFRWSDLAPDDVAHDADEPPRPAWLKGVLRDPPVFQPPILQDESGFTRSTLDVTAIHDGRRWLPGSGRVRLTIAGDRSDLAAGQPVRAAGTLAGVPAPTNPGERDARLSLRTEGVRMRLTIGEPEGIQVDPDGRSSTIRALLGRVRTWSQQRLTARLDPRTAPLAAALLLGRREAIDAEVNDAFIRTGTTHLLAISGLHLQALAFAATLFCRVLGLGVKGTCAVVLVGVLMYAVLIGAIPSVVRSTAMTMTICVGTLIDRPTLRSNVLALAALVTLILDPTDLFDPGCQLSYLAVATLFWGVPAVLSGLEGRTTSPLDILEQHFEPAWRKVIREGRNLALTSLLASTLVWLVTAPLVALRFHLISPIGILLNLPLVPMTSVALLLAGLTLALSLIWPPLAHLPGRACSGLLTWTEGLVRMGASQNWGYTFTPGPPTVWVLVLYGLALAASLAGPLGWGGRARRWLFGSLAAWALVLPVVGLGLRLAPAGMAEVEVLDVGHGLAVIIRTSGGRATLYDCGRLRDPGVGRRRIAPALWARGVERLDQVILSHADADHFDGLPDLLDRFAVGRLYVAPGFQGSRNPAAARVLEAVHRHRVPVLELAAGDELDLGAGLTATVLHPSRTDSLELPDNARSLVLDLVGRGRHVLLTGDLDGPGLAAVVSRPAPVVDAWLAPHHGGRSANPPWLYDWCRPKLVLVSQQPPMAGSADPLAFLADRGIRCLRTWQHGAIRLRWTDAGLVPSGYRDESAKTPAVWLRTSMAQALSGLKRLRMQVPLPGLRFVIAVVGLILGLLACIGLAIVEWGAWALVRPGGRPGMIEPHPWEPIAATAPDGTHLAGAWLGAERASGRTALLLHGYGEDRTVLIRRGELLARWGWNAALLDARGRGRSGGQWITFGAKEAEDVKAWLDTLSDRIGPSFQPVIWGRSLGAVIALRAAVAENRLRAVVLEAPYAELLQSVSAGLKRRHIPRFLARAMLARASRLAGVALDSPPPIVLAHSLQQRALILLGLDDLIAPPEEVRRLAASLARPPTVIEVAGARHGDIFDLADPDALERLRRFLDDALTETLRSPEPASESR